MMWMWQEQTGTANSHWDQTLQTKQSQLRLQLIPCCAAVEAPCWFSGSGGGGAKHVGWHRADKCVASIALNWLKPPTWFVLKGKRVLCFIAFSCRTWGQPVGGDFSVFHNWARDWKKKKSKVTAKNAKSNMCIGFERWWSPASPWRDTHPDGRRAACTAEWMRLLSDFLHHEDKWSPAFIPRASFSREAPAGVNLKTSIFKPAECGARLLPKRESTTFTVHIL